MLNYLNMMVHNLDPLDCMLTKRNELLHILIYKGRHSRRHVQAY